MYKLKYKLKQHTPIIHFQHNEKGATLRASELKPKLDKFLIKKIGKQNIPKDWYINEEKGALNFKVKIVAHKPVTNKMPEKFDERNNKWQTNYYPTFFANMGKESKDELVNFTKYEYVELIIICISAELKLIIENGIDEFLFKNNFGTRQSKGFGCFLREGVNLNQFENNRYLTIPNNGNINDEDIFNVINYYFQRLKSGINFDYENRRNGNKFTHYQHSFLKLFLSGNTDYEWEKKWMKEKFIGLPQSGTNYKFVRALLGLVDGYTFRPTRNPKPNQVYPAHQVSINVKSANVARFRSPIIFKPINLGNEWRIYIMIENIPKEMLNEQFEFSSRDDSYKIKTPNSAINLSDLIRDYHTHLNREFTAYTFTGRPNYKVQVH